MATIGDRARALETLAQQITDAAAATTHTIATGGTAPDVTSVQTAVNAIRDEINDVRGALNDLLGRLR